MSKKEQILKLIREGRTSQDIVKIVGVKPQYVRDIAWQYQVKLPQPPRKLRMTSEKYPLLAELMIEKHISVEDIGNVICISGGAVRRRLKKGCEFLKDEQDRIQAAFFPEVSAGVLFGQKDKAAACAEKCWRQERAEGECLWNY